MSATGAARLLNVGCGSTFHRAWVNLDVAPTDATIMQWDVKRGLPFGAESFDAVYCSHVLEHLARGEAKRFVADCFRVLKPAGVARFVVPDLEAIAREYLRLMDAFRSRREVEGRDYDWIVLELLDQVGRERSGGDMAPFLRSLAPGERAYVLSRVGEEARRAWAGRPQAKPAFWTRIARMGVAGAIGKLRIRAASAAVRALAGPGAAAAFRAGWFRQGGEVHRWMYDEFSLSGMLRAAGFAEVSRHTAVTSSIPDFASFLLDTDVQGDIRKPDSLFIEGRRPASPALGVAGSGHKGAARK